MCRGNVRCGRGKVSLWLDGAFWGSSIRQNFVSEIQWMRRAVFQHMLPSFPDPEREADKAGTEAWETAMSQPYDGWEGPGKYAEWAEEKELETYEGVIGMRQSTVNLGTAMLWHLLEQQMLFFHMRQVLKIPEEREVRETPKTRKKLFSLEEFHKRLNSGGCSMESLPSWSKVDELRLVANVVKHGSGKSLDDLCEIRADMLRRPGEEPLEPRWSNRSWVDRPANGEDLYVTDQDLTTYFDAAVHLWLEFSEAIEAHSARRQ